MKISKTKFYLVNDDNARDVRIVNRTFASLHEALTFKGAPTPRLHPRDRAMRHAIAERRLCGKNR